MRLSPTDEQALIQSSVQALLAKEYSFAQRQHSLDAGNGCHAAPWDRFARMGWLALPLPERVGGLGAGAVEAGLLMQAFGRHLVIEPYHASVLLASRLLAELGREDQCQAWLTGLIDGRLRAALAHDEIANPGPWAPRVTTATRGQGCWELHGDKQLVLGAPGAGLLLVSASVDAPGAATRQQRVFLVPPDAPGLSMQPAVTVHGAHAADLRLTGVRLADQDLLGHDADATPTLHRVCAQALIALCWEAGGAMRAAYEQTAAHVRQRVQFGRPLSEFQVVAHRLAEMAVSCEEAQAACELASLRVQRGEPDEPALASMVKGKVGHAARYVAQQAVQLHGAMGVSEELPIAGFFRRLTAFEHQSGATDWHDHYHGHAMLQGDAWHTSRTLPAVA